MKRAIAIVAIIMILSQAVIGVIYAADHNWRQAAIGGLLAIVNCFIFLGAK